MKNNNSFKNPVFYVSAFIVLLLVVIGATTPKKFGEVANTLFNFTTNNFGWFYLLAVFVFILFLIAISFSKFGKMRLGAADSKPEYSFFTWIGMLFSAGFGAGLVFWGVAEPMSHFFNTPFPELESMSEESARVAMGYAFFHWGISQWSVFAVVGLVIAYLQFKKKERGLISTSIQPVVGKNRVLGDTIDSLAVIATVMGVATSLGLGILQMNGGLKSVFDVPTSIWVQIGIAAVMLITYLISSSTGLDRGIKWLSNINLGLCLLLLVFVFLAGPTVFILNTFVLGLGDYFTNFVQYSLRLTPYSGESWVRDWTIFYWAWSTAWSPFVGAFVARVSRGRSIRQYVVGVLVVSPAIACLWIAAFGGTALYSDLFNGTSIAEAVNADVAVALFETYQHLPFTTILSLLSIFLIFTFLVTSADSATYILGSMTSRGSLNPALLTKIVWGVLITAIAVVLLLAGGLEALQTASLISALPFTVILLIMMISFLRMINKDYRKTKKEEENK
ncbi:MULTISPECIES: BCCT family transporter [Virgibacillus]|uniref:Glycine betaine transporter OpuD n=2 Tax=Virgibacillus TaxID=84406 RepID=A0A024Q9H3_9BACI|nr:MULTISPECIES: BCCT family transporter [Virgibacillus]EQB37368.1 glycine/betaine ABC transporter permease [Virgibacillus sp. CM-4]MYL40121.1 BCCT family transporter [Virgibacillus massiliensis]GGJ61429.1 glycine/betaine ABC transporter permease [Virgibacillus kapii]CDQ39134.1 Glycine betaine transporter OpuD [Virgibacillus massiliensis]